MMCLESAGRLPMSDYRRATLYTTLSPCSMCSGAVLHYQIPRVVIADSEHFQGEEMLLMTRGVEVMSLDFPDAKVLVVRSHAPSQTDGSNASCVGEWADPPPPSQLRQQKEFIELHPDLWAEDTGMEAGSGGGVPRPLAAAAPTPALPAPAVPAIAAAPAEPEPLPVAYEEPAPYAAPPRSATPQSMMGGGDNLSQYGGNQGQAPSQAGDTFLPSASTTPLPPDDDAVLPPSAPPSMYGDDAASQRDGAGSVVDAPQQ